MKYTIGTFPYIHFASGHTFFTQSLQSRLGFSPVRLCACSTAATWRHAATWHIHSRAATWQIAVHTTFQFGDTAEFAWGKRSRLREKLLWKVDAPHYFAFEGDYSPGKGASEEGYGGSNPSPNPNPNP